ncbi:MAG: putative porin [Prevotella sp.]|nr:putative porin [Prevotella sp.]
MKKYFFLLFCLLSGANAAFSQIESLNGLDSFNNNGQSKLALNRSDSTQTHHKEVPKGLKVWTIDERFGDRMVSQPDTASFMYMNTIFTSGLRGEYNTLGNLGAPRQNRIFIDRRSTKDFFFLDPYDYFLVEPQDFKFTSTLSPITNLTYTSAGDRTNGEDRFRALFAINFSKRIGIGFKFDYLYGRGYYDHQSSSHINYSMWGSYLGERYQAHILFGLNHQKVAENGGIANDAYITNPEAFNESYTEDEIPTILSKNWNRNDNQHVFFNHRYSVGFFRKVPMTQEEIDAKKFAMKSSEAQRKEADKEQAKKKARESGRIFDEATYEKTLKSQGRPENARIVGDAPNKQEKMSADSTRISVDLQDKDQLAKLQTSQSEKKDAAEQWMKEEYVPVTSFIHTMRFDNYRRIYQGYETPQNFYANNYYNIGSVSNDSIYDRTKAWSLKNTFAVALLEGFNKWAKAGLKAFISHEMRRYEMPAITTTATSSSPLMMGYETWNKQDISVGGQLLKTTGKHLQYNLNGEVWLAGERAGQLHLDGVLKLNIRALNDSLQLSVNAFLHRDMPSFLMYTYHSRHLWWDNNELSQIVHSRVWGELAIAKTHTKLRAGYDLIKNHTYFGVQNDHIANGNNYLIENNVVNVRQEKEAISLFTLQLQQDFKLGFLHWQNVVTFQKSSNNDIMPVPTLNVYTNLFTRFKIAKVLRCDLGVDMRYFTKYNAPEYIPIIGSFGIQETDASKTKIGNYPVINAYANFHLKQTRFFIMMSHLNKRDGGSAFFTPHYPINPNIIRLGVSWNFFN